jgi:hypothetical protein
LTSAIAEIAKQAFCSTKAVTKARKALVGSGVWFQAIRASLFGPRLHVRLINLDDISAGSE